MCARPPNSCDRSLEAVIAAAKPGVLDATLKAAYLKDDAGGRRRHAAQRIPSSILARGPCTAAACRCPGASEPVDQILVEYPVAFRRYNVKTEWMILFGHATDRQRHMYDAAREHAAPA